MLRPAEQQKSDADNVSSCLFAREQEKRWTCLYRLHYPGSYVEQQHKEKVWF